MLKCHTYNVKKYCKVIGTGSVILIYLFIFLQVLHSQSLNKTPLKPWVIAEKNGIICSAHCTCMAGLGETCTHVSALLFHTDAVIRVRNLKTPTQAAAYWKIPVGIQGDDYKAAKDIDFTSAKKKQSLLNEEISFTAFSGVPVPNKTPRGRSRSTHVPNPTPLDVSNMFAMFSLNNQQPAAMKIFKGHSKHFIPIAVSGTIPDPLTNLFDPNLLNSTLSELQNIIHSNSFSIKVTPDQVKIVEEETRGQSKKDLWFKLRAGRLTASRMKAVCHSSIESPSCSLLKGICQSNPIPLQNDAIEWGKMKEKRARSEYLRFMQTRHENFCVKECGLVLHESYPYFGASPDGFVSCDCCGKGVLEIKCPYKFRDCTIVDVVNDRDSCLVQNDQNVELKNSHAYMYQVQTQLLLCNVDYVDFVVWTKRDMHVERIEKDEEKLNEIKKRGKLYFDSVVLPELLGHYFSNPLHEDM